MNKSRYILFNLKVRHIDLVIEKLYAPSKTHLTCVVYHGFG